MTEELEDNSQNNEEEERVTLGQFIKDIIRFTLLSLLIVVPIRVFVAQPFLVSGSSMKPTFYDGEYLVIDELSYYFDKPARGQVVVFRFPLDPSKYFIKRIIGLPGETIKLDGGKIYISNPTTLDVQQLDEKYLTNVGAANRDLTITLNDNEYFVMGDNRDASSDSREWGPLDRKMITGKVLLRLLPINRAEILPGAPQKFNTPDTKE